MACLGCDIWVLVSRVTLSVDVEATEFHRRVNVHEGSNDATAVAGAHLHRDADASLNAAANVVAIPHNQYGDHWIPELFVRREDALLRKKLDVHSGSSQKGADILSRRNMCGDQ